MTDEELKTFAHSADIENHPDKNFIKQFRK